MRRQTIAAIWIGGLILALLLYITGPDRFVEAALNTLDAVDEALRTMLTLLGMQAFNAVRALTIALYVVFVVLSGLAIHRGLRAWGGLIVISLLFAVLVWHPWFQPPAPMGRWLTALILCAAGALVVTQRLLTPPPPFPPTIQRPGWTPPPGPRA